MILIQTLYYRDINEENNHNFPWIVAEKVVDKFTANVKKPAKCNCISFNINDVISESELHLSFQLIGSEKNLILLDLITNDHSVIK